MIIITSGSDVDGDVEAPVGHVSEDGACNVMWKYTLASVRASGLGVATNWNLQVFIRISEIFEKKLILTIILK